MKQKLSLFENTDIRKVYKNNTWYYSINDVISYLTDSSNPTEYIKKIKQKDIELQHNWNTICINLNMSTKDGKIRKVMSSDVVGILRIIQNITTEKTEHIKMWLAQLGNERLEEIYNPELLMDRMKIIYEMKGYSNSWIEKREKEITARHSLQEEWKKIGISLLSEDYLILRNEIYQSSFGISLSEYQKLKDVNQEYVLKDSMTNLELAILNLSEVAIAEFHQQKHHSSIDGLKHDINEMGNIINKTKTDIEFSLNKSIISKENYMNLTHDKP